MKALITRTSGRNTVEIFDDQGVTLYKTHLDKLDIEVLTLSGINRFDISGVANDPAPSGAATTEDQ